jgi:type IV secretion system protein VirB9
VRMVPYDPGSLVRLTTYYGVSTHIQFAQGEVVKEIAVGDEQAWSIVPRANHLFVKPRAANADTNVTVVTDRRVYQFLLVVDRTMLRDPEAWRNPNLVFSLAFQYEDEQLATQLKSAGEGLRELLSTAKAPQNFDYWVAGSSTLAPSAANDDGRFIYLTFSNNQDMPAVYETDADGRDALINTHVEGNTIVVQRLVRHITLRKGRLVACVVNKAFDSRAGVDTSSGTVSPRVERVLKGGRP